MRRARWLSVACLLSPLLGCVTGQYGKVTVNEAIDSERLHALQPGRDDLTTCLAALGAPVSVREYQVGLDGRSGMALVWFWSRQVGWGLRFSGSIVRNANASFQFDWAGTNLPGCVLWFDQDLVLEGYQEGLVGRLLQSRVRPSPVLDS